MKVPRGSLTVFACLWFGGLPTEGFQDVRLELPEAVTSGEAVTMSCCYSLDENEALYSIRWYRNNVEFYRYVPKESPPTRVFHMRGVRIDLARSDDHEVTLLHVTREMSGYYKCEVSADAPSFHTVIRSAYMTVVETPRDGPVIAVDRDSTTVRANCTSALSFPAANITWYVNGHPVPESMTVVVSEPASSLETTLSVLDLDAGAAPRLRLWCVATLYDLYRCSSEELQLRQSSPRISPVVGSTASGVCCGPTPPWTALMACWGVARLGRPR